MFHCPANVFFFYLARRPKPRTDPLCAISPTFVLCPCVLRLGCEKIDTSFSCSCFTNPVKNCTYNFTHFVEGSGASPCTFIKLTTPPRKGRACCLASPELRCKVLKTISLWCTRTHPSIRSSAPASKNLTPVAPVAASSCVRSPVLLRP